MPSGKLGGRSGVVGSLSVEGEEDGGVSEFGLLLLLPEDEDEEESEPEGVDDCEESSGEELEV